MAAVEWQREEGLVTLVQPLNPCVVRAAARWPTFGLVFFGDGVVIITTSAAALAFWLRPRPPLLVLAARSVACGVGCDVWSLEFGVRSAECKVWGVELRHGLRSMGCGARGRGVWGMGSRSWVTRVCEIQKMHAGRQLRAVGSLVRPVPRTLTRFWSRRTSWRSNLIILPHPHAARCRVGVPSPEAATAPPPLRHDTRRPCALHPHELPSASAHIHPVAVLVLDG